MIQSLPQRTRLQNFQKKWASWVSIQKYS